MKKKPQNLPPAKPPRARIVPRGNATRIIAIGNRKFFLSDLYARLLATRWRYLALIIATLYLSANTLFAVLYLAGGTPIENARPGSFADVFFFSVQTMATIGYGKMIPLGIYANCLVTLEALFGFGFFAVVTGMVFAKFSRPTARVLFSNVAVIGQYNGKPHLMLRLANQRRNRIVDVTAQMVALRSETSVEGHFMRRFYDMKLTRRQVPLMQITWTLMHPIDEDSPIYGMGPAELAANEVEIIISLVGLDETLSQTIHARHSYIDEEIACGSAFKDILVRKPNGELEVHYDEFHTVVPHA